MNFNHSIVNISLILILFVFQITNAYSEDKTYYDRISLRAEASTEVDNDTLIAILYVQREGAEPATLANEVNKIIEDAVGRVKKQPDITLKTLAYQTNPVYQKQRLSGWRVRQSIQLKSQDVKILSQLVGNLQSLLAVESISYAVSQALRLKTEEELIGEAILAFNSRAEKITSHLGRTTYRLVSMDVQTNSAPFRPVAMHSMAMMESARVAPVIEPGTQTLMVDVSGVIELVVN